MYQVEGKKFLKKKSLTLSPAIACDCESTGLDLRHGCKPFMATGCDEDGETCAWEWEVDGKTRQPKVTEKDRKEIVKKYSGKVIIFHNAKFDIRAFSTIGIGFYFEEDDWLVSPPPGKYKPLIIKCITYHDTILMAHAIASSWQLGLKELSVRLLRYGDDDEKELQRHVISARAKAKSLGGITLGVDLNDKKSPYSDYWLPRHLDPSNDVCLRYALKDVERTILLFQLFKDIIEEEGLWKGYIREHRLLQTVYKMETGGLPLKKQRTLDKVKELDKQTSTFEEKIISYVKSKSKLKDFNPNSGKQMVEFLYRTLRLKIGKKTKNGNPSCDKEALASLCKKTKDKKCKDFLTSILRMRIHGSGLTYLKSYLRFALKYPNSSKFLILFPSLHQSGTGTTRFSCSQPNGQNISKLALVEIKISDFEIYEVEGPRLRDCFGPPPGKIWYAIDYNQLELRVFAKVSNEKSLIKALLDGYDFHGYVSTRIFKRPIEQITKQQRTIAKNTNFAIIFGAGPAKVNQTAGIDDAYELFVGLFPNVHSFMEKTIAEVRKEFHVYTLDGYRLDVPKNAPYKGVNYIVQGSAGSIVKNAMIDIDALGLVDWSTCRIVLQIHDELIIEFDLDSPLHTPTNLLKIMNVMEESGSSLGVLTPVSCERITTDYGHGKKVKVTKTGIYSTAA